ncbi:hypothetical protein A2Z22_00095 [Candidatus Woesebacteria bacterium RBG_16_34_12]|uniref:Methyltransferase domain-containing protein n=1 Tax=Candidatus Woesebacteria bacterium RBG_16_34_12 TaxID=1802480 RepID=A0A1F7XAL9_9BACT|nr:MAG: hypothetical protein A2Z22_00095 [Candidatus Woesebacteria bacterium RBG_16_34_12]
MSENVNLTKTKNTYEDPCLVTGYAQKHSYNPKMQQAVEKFAKTLTGKRIVDVGCGPGHDSWHFARLGFEVTGVDLSSEMIKVAKSLETAKKPPTFLQGDMTELDELFKQDSFDGAWLCASLLHIPRKLVPKVLSGLRKIVTNHGKIYIGVKKGEGEQLKVDTNYGVEAKRYFVYWQKDNFRQILKDSGFVIEKFDQQTRNETTWLNFYLENRK